MSISININGTSYSDWDSSQVLSSVASLSDMFVVSGRNRFGKFEIKAGDPVKVYVADELQITGYIDEVVVNLDDTITISGRDKTRDLVDCQLPGQTTFNQLSVVDIIAAIADQYGVSLTVQGGLTTPTVESFVVAKDETGASAIQRLAVDYALVVNSDRDGNLHLQDGSELDDTGITFEEGNSISKAYVIASDKQRYSDYEVIGQRYALTQVSGSVMGTSTNTRVFRKIIDGEADSATCNLSASRMSCYSEGQAVRMVMEPVGLYLLNAGTTVSIAAPTLGVSGKMVVEQALTKIDSTDTKTVFTLVSPEAYGGEPTKCKWLK